MLLDLFLLSPHVEIEDQILNAQLIMGETVGHVGIWYICVKMAPDSRFLIHIPNSNPNTHQESGTNFALDFHFATFGLIFKIENILFVNVYEQRGLICTVFSAFELLKQNTLSFAATRSIADAMKVHINYLQKCFKACLARKYSD